MHTDHWSFRPGLISLSAVALLTIFWQLPGTVSFYLVPLSALGYAIGACALAVITIIQLFKKRPKRAASILLVLLLPVLMWRPICFGAEIVHLGMTVGFGAGQLGQTAISSPNQFQVFDWSTGFAGSNTFLIHDVTDEIALPMAQHLHPPNPVTGFEEECAGKVDHLLGHYYVCSD